MRVPRWLATLPLSLAFHVVIVAAAVAFFRMDSVPPGLIVDLNAIIAGRDDGPGADAGPAAGSSSAPRTAPGPRPAAPTRAPVSRPASPSASVTPPAPEPSATPSQTVTPLGTMTVPQSVTPSQSAAPSQTATPSQPPASSSAAAPSASAPTSGSERGLGSAAGSSAAGGTVSAQRGTAASGTGFGAGEGGRAGDQIAAIPPGGGGGAGAGAGSEYAAYLARVRQRIQEALRYPVAARRRSVTGTVQLEIAIAPDGAISSVSVVASSSHDVLDRAAADAARSLPRVPFPSDVRPRPLRVRLPVVFELQ